MNKIITPLLYAAFGFFAMSALFGIAKAAWNSPVTAGTPLGMTLWNERDNKITELENRMNAVHNLTQGTACGITSQFRTQACRPTDPPSGMVCSVGDMIDPGTNGLNFCIRQ